MSSVLGSMRRGWSPPSALIETAMLPLWLLLFISFAVTWGECRRRIANASCRQPFPLSWWVFTRLSLWWHHNYLYNILKCAKLVKDGKTFYKQNSLYGENLKHIIFCSIAAKLVEVIQMEWQVFVTLIHWFWSWNPEPDPDPGFQVNLDPGPRFLEESCHQIQIDNTQNFRILYGKYKLFWSNSIIYFMPWQASISSGIKSNKNFFFFKWGHFCLPLPGSRKLKLLSPDPKPCWS